MGRSTLAAVAVAVLLALAGCGGAGTTTTPGGPAIETTTGQSTTAGTPAGDPYTGTGAELVERGLATDVAADSFTVVRTLTYVEAGAEREVLQSVRRVNRTTDRASLLVDQQVFGNTTTVRYTEGETTYRRVNGSSTDGVRYALDRAPYDGEVRPVERRLAAGPAVEEFLGAFRWAQRGVVERDGRVLTRYVATEVLDPSVVTGGVQGEARNVSVTILVSRSGVMVEQRVRYDLERDGQTIDVRQTVTVERVGTTTVAEPDWLDEAREASDGDGDGN